MHQFRVEHPKVSLRVTTGSPEELIEKMERGEVDLICILDEPRYSNSWHKCNEIPEEVVFVGFPGHRPRPPRPVPGSRASGQALLSHRTQRQLPPHL